jgi:DNA (cytosine-5)-methyltransferase 1
MSLTFGSLFAGIGGIDLGLERAGMVCRWQVEIDDYASKVLAKHWPMVHREKDVRKCGLHNLERVDVIAAGFPCQDISYAGAGAGMKGERSGLFYEASRIIRELGPRFVLLENVSALLTRGIGDVLGTLASIGYDSEYHCIPASYFGAPHRRDRIWIVANSRHWGRRDFGNAERGKDSQGKWPADTDSTCRSSLQSEPVAKPIEWPDPPRIDWWDSEPSVGRMADGIPRRMDRVKCLGNSVVPQVAEFIGKGIFQLAERLNHAAS